MMYPNYYSAQNVYQEQMRDERREIEAWRLTREAGVKQRGVFLGAACAVICGAGRTLVRAGEAMQRAVETEVARPLMGSGVNTNPVH
jgi:hypothetical protein